MHLAEENSSKLSQALGWSALTIPVLIWSIRGIGKPSFAFKTPRELKIVCDDRWSDQCSICRNAITLPVPVVGATSHICPAPHYLRWSWGF